jgi:holliday junction DNA helicase RuvA
MEDDGTVIVTVGGVGYEMVAPLGALGRAVKNELGTQTFHIHTHAREDALALFGFATEADRFAFRQLISVSGVGPKIAVAVLSALPAAELGKAIARKELSALTMISGIGKKTAERLVLELRDKIPETGATPGVSSVRRTSAKPASDDKSALLTQALVNMGYKAAEAERAVASVSERLAELDLSALLREALQSLSK